MGKLGSKIPSGSWLALMMEKYGKPGMLPAVLKQLLSLSHLEYLWEYSLSRFMRDLGGPHYKQINCWYLLDGHHSKSKVKNDLESQKERLRKMEGFTLENLQL